MIITNFKPPVEPVRFNLTEGQYILVMPIGDVHKGSSGWPEEKFKAHIKWGMDRGAFFLGMGEFLDLASETQRQLMRLLRPNVRVELDELLREEADKLLYLLNGTEGRWLGAIEGDHRWDFGDAGANDPQSVDQYICERLRCPFLGTSTYITLDAGIEGHPEANCNILATHGVGASRLAGGQLHRVEDLMKFWEADIYLMGHNHAKVNAALDRQYVTPDGRHYHRTKIIARTGGWMKSYISNDPFPLNEDPGHSRANYIEKLALPPSAMGGLCFGIGAEQINGSNFWRPTIHYSV